MRSLIFMCVFALGGAAIQEIILHDSYEDGVGNSYTFRESVPDLTIYPFFNKTVRICCTVNMLLYTEQNYLESYIHYRGAECVNLTKIYRSIRFYGNRNTLIDAVSLYSAIGYYGEDVYVERSAYAGIERNMIAAGYSGKSAWTVFEGSNFDGKSACFAAGLDTYYHYNLRADFNITGVRSLIKGCVTNVTPEMRKQLQKEAFESQYTS